MSSLAIELVDYRVLIVWNPEDPALLRQSPLEVSRASDASRKFRVLPMLRSLCVLPMLRSLCVLPMLRLHYACTAKKAAEKCTATGWDCCAHYCSDYLLC